MGGAFIRDKVLMNGTGNRPFSQLHITSNKTKCF